MNKFDYHAVLYINGSFYTAESDDSADFLLYRMLTLLYEEHDAAADGGSLLLLAETKAFADERRLRSGALPHHAAHIEAGCNQVVLDIFHGMDFPELHPTLCAQCRHRGTDCGHTVQGNHCDGYDLNLCPLCPAAFSAE